MEATPKQQSSAERKKFDEVSLIYVPLFIGGKHRGASMGPAAMKVAAVRMHGMLDESERLAASLPEELMEVITPVQQMLEQVCQKSVRALTPQNSVF